MKSQNKNIDFSKEIALLPHDVQPYFSAYFAYSNDEGYITAAGVNQFLINTGWTLPVLMNYLVPFATHFAVPPISKFQVGAVAHGISGAIYFGANIEFVGEALSFCVHAEQAAIAHAINYSEKGIDYLAISAAPCGYCRQFLYEITNCKSTPDITVLTGTTSTQLSALLPQAFGPQDLNVTTRLMLPQFNNLQISPSPGDPGIVLALDAANLSYSPYSSDFAGICIFTSTNYYLGSYAENAAYNPSMSPLEAALVMLIMSGDSYSNINRVILVEATASQCSQFEVSSDVLASIAPAIKLEHYLATASTQLKETAM
jgi:cytidine deaminase